MNQALREHFAAHVASMCPDCQRRFETNISRMLDCKCEPCQGPILAAPDVTAVMGEASKAYFAAVRAHLDRLGVHYIVAPRLVRGLDYYEQTVFEVTHHGLGAQSAMAGGGRYRIALPGSDRTVEGVGFACGMERLLMVREHLRLAAHPAAAPQVYLVCLGEPALAAALPLAQQLRHAGLRVLAETAPRSMKAQMRAANKAGARFALIQGDDELAKGTLLCKDLAASTQEEIPVAAAADRLLAALA
jgi:histidyl-tRNA synthetase